MKQEKLPLYEGTGGGYKPCYTTHPALPVGDFKVYGGSCGTPVVQDADIYIGFDGSMRATNAYPWNPPSDIIRVYFPIPDMGIPSNADEFKKMIEWAAVQLMSNKKIHFGCIGGHGRTGMALSALVAHVTGRKDAITYVRENYCQKAVESGEQVAFLVKLYGVDAVKGAKSHLHVHSETADYRDYRTNSSWNSKGKGSAPSPYVPMASRKTLPKGTATSVPINGPMSIWGDSVTFDKQVKPVTIGHIQEGN